MLDDNLPLRRTSKCRRLMAYVRWAERMKRSVWSRIMVAISVAWLLAVAGLVGYEYQNCSVFCRYDGDGAACQQIFLSWAYAAPGKFEFTIRYSRFLATSLLPVVALWLGVSEFLCHQSYPVGHLSTMYWLGLQKGDIHWNISSPGWAKHAWSCLFAPWIAGATIFVYNPRNGS